MPPRLDLRASAAATPEPARFPDAPTAPPGPLPGALRPEVPQEDPLPRAVPGVADGGAAEAPAPQPLQCGNRGNTFRPSRRKRVNKHGLEKRLSTPEGREVLLRRLRKGRWRITVDAFR